MMVFKETLPKSATNDVEILEFLVNDQSFGVRVEGIEAVVQFDPDRFSRIPMDHPSVVGTLLLRDDCLTLVDLSLELLNEMDSPVSASANDTNTIENKLLLITEFKDHKTAFLVDEIHRIHQVPQDTICHLSPFLASTHCMFTASLQVENREILIVDLEKVEVALPPLRTIGH